MTIRHTKSGLAVVLLAIAASLLVPGTAGAQETPPAGGAEIGEVILATAMGLVFTALVVGPIALYRTGRLPALGRLADRLGRLVGLPGWAALPLAVHGTALIVAVFGMYWDISLHIDNGRDPGPLANPAHHFILIGLMGVTGAGVLGMALPRQPIRSSLHLAGVDWNAPVGALLITVCGAFSLIAFPLDDVWHRLFGQDVTLWSPTHLMLITGASLSVFGGLALYREALEETDESVAAPARAGWLLAPLAGALLIGLNTFMAEFDFAVPQFRLDMHPIGLMLAAGLGLVTARLVIGPLGALATVGFFLLIRGALTLLVGPLLGQTEPHFALYLAEALAVEGVAFAFARSGRPITTRPAIFGATAGAAIGTFGLAAEWGWSYVFFEHPWTASMLPEAAVLGLVMAVAAGTIGGFAGRALSLRGTRLAPAPYWALPLATATVVVVVLIGVPIADDADAPITASVQLEEVVPEPEREVEATVRIEPADAADDARWFNVTAWQGGEPSVVADMEEQSAGVFTSPEPIPVHGTWKSILRLQRGNEVIGLPIFLPEDPAIPASEVPAEPSFTRDFILDKENLQREQKEGVSGVVTVLSYGVVGVMTAAVIAMIFWGLRRVRRRLGSDGRPPATGTPFSREPARGAPEPAM